MFRWLLAAVLLVSSEGCAGGSVASPNPCAYVSAAEVAPIVGGPVKTGVTTTEGYFLRDHESGCLFEPVGHFTIAQPDSNATFIFAIVGFVDEQTYDFYRRDIEPTASVDGLGDQAFIAGNMHMNLLFVARGPYRVGVEVMAGLADFAEEEKALARIVLARLGAGAIRAA